MGFDCQTCGACCINPCENQREGRTDYVAVEHGAKLLSRPDLLRKFVARDEAEGIHLRILADQRCAALRGAVGRSVHCAIYSMRPQPCRTVQPGDGDCERARREFL